MTNPQWRISLTHDEGPVSLFLEAPVKYPVNIRLMRGKDRVTSVSQAFEVASSGDYRPGFCYTELEELEAGDYVVIPSTFSPGRKIP